MIATYCNHGFLSNKMGSGMHIDLWIMSRPVQTCGIVWRFLGDELLKLCFSDGTWVCLKNTIPL
jgi:hypothetical protein